MRGKQPLWCGSLPLVAGVGLILAVVAGATAPATAAIETRDGPRSPVPVDELWAPLRSGVPEQPPEQGRPLAPFSGDSDRLVPESSDFQVVTSLGVGEPFWSLDKVAQFAGDGGFASSAKVSRPTTLVSDRQGGYYFADSMNHRIRHVDAVGRIKTVVGSGRANSPLRTCAWDVPALQACLIAPHGITLDSRGRLIIADTFHNVITRVDEDGMLRRIAGSGAYCDRKRSTCGEGGPALEAALKWPTIARATPAGLVISDTSDRVLLVRNGIITRLAGTGEPGFSGDGGPAAEARLFAPADAVPYRDGWLISDGNNCRLRYVDSAGIIHPFAGYGTDVAECWTWYGTVPTGGEWGGPIAGDVGDGGPALNAKFAVTGFIALEGDTVYLTDFLNSRVRRIADGVVDTVIGTGDAPGVSTDGPAPGSQFRLGWTSGVAWDAERSMLLVSDSGTNRILLASRAGGFATPQRAPMVMPPQVEPAKPAARPGHGAAVISWRRPAGATGHIVTAAPVRGGPSRHCVAKADDFCVVYGLTNHAAHEVTVAPMNAGGLGRVPATVATYVVPFDECQVQAPVTGSRDTAMARAIAKRIVVDPVFKAEFGGLLARDMPCNPSLMAAIRWAVAVTIRMEPDGEVAHAIRAAMIARVEQENAIRANPNGPEARLAAAVLAIN